MIVPEYVFEAVDVQKVENLRYGQPGFYDFGSGLIANLAVPVVLGGQ